MQSTQPSPERTATRRFRAPTLEDALEAARQELGPDIELLEANRIRRGGVGGFFATDLGVEIVVAEAPQLVATGAPRAKPHFYDRVVEEDLAPSGLDRLIEDATRAERAHRRAARRTDAAGRAMSERLDLEMSGPELSGPAMSTPAMSTPERSTPEMSTSHAVDAGPGSFAAHFAREMRDQLPPQECLTSEYPMSEEYLPPAEPALAVAAPTPADEIPELPRARRLQPERAREPQRASRARRSAVRSTRTPTRAATRTATRTATRRDPLRRPSELAAAAASRLITDLAEVVARDGSRVEDLARLRVSITTPDGAVIELTAEMEGRERE